MLFFREKEVCQHLEEYICRASGLVKQKKHLIEVSVLCVQCMEVSAIIFMSFYIEIRHVHAMNIKIDL